MWRMAILCGVAHYFAQTHHCSSLSSMFLWYFLNVNISFMFIFYFNSGLFLSFCYYSYCCAVCFQWAFRFDFSTLLLLFAIVTCRWRICASFVLKNIFFFHSSFINFTLHQPDVRYMCDKLCWQSWEVWTGHNNNFYF